MATLSRIICRKGREEHALTCRPLAIPNLTVRTRWVDYNKHDYDAGQIEPGWHGWISYMVDKPPTEDPVLRTGNNKWDLQKAVPNLTATSGNYITYST